MADFGLKTAHLELKNRQNQGVLGYCLVNGYRMQVIESMQVMREVGVKKQPPEGGGVVVRRKGYGPGTYLTDWAGWSGIFFFTLPLCAPGGEYSATPRDGDRFRRSSVVVTHPSAKNAEGWGTHIGGKVKIPKNLGCARACSMSTSYFPGLRNETWATHSFGGRSDLGHPIICGRSAAAAQTPLHA